MYHNWKKKTFFFCLDTIGMPSQIGITVPTTSITSLTTVHMLMYLHCLVLEQKIKEVGFMLGTYLNTGPAQVAYTLVMSIH